MNKCFITGNLTKDPEVKQTNSGNTVANFTVAVPRRFKNPQGERESDFFPVVAWRGTAEFIGKYIRRGSRVAVIGTLQTRSYDGQDGQRRYITEIIADEVQGFDRREQQGEQTAFQPAQMQEVEPDDEEFPF